MSVQWQLPRDVPADTAQVGQAILAPDNLYRQLGDRFDTLFPVESVFAPMYAPTGRGAIPPLLLALVTVLQMLEKAPDRVAAAWVVSRLDWKYALHLPLTYRGFHFTDLSAFRQRLLDHAAERRLLDELLQRLKAQGLLPTRPQMRTDSTHVLGLVEHLTQLELLTESLRVALRAVTELAPAWVSAHLPHAFCEMYASRQSEYGLSQTEVARQLVSVGRDGVWFLAQLDQTAPEPLPRLPEVDVLRTVLAQQFPDGAGGPPAPKRPSGRAIIESPHEPEVRRSAKRGQGWVGYKLQVTETCDADTVHLITDIEATDAVDNDSPALPAIQARLAAHASLPSQQYVDQGYVSGANIVSSAKLGIDLIGMPLPAQGPDGFRQTDFALDEAAQQASCPTGQIAPVWRARTDPDGGPARIHVRFDAATCQACPHFGVCTTSRQGRSLTLHPYREVLEARRAEAQTEAYRTQLRRRNGIEGTLSELVRAHAARTARYRGRAKLRLQALFTALAVNLKRLTRWWTARPSVTTGVLLACVLLCLYPVVKVHENLQSP